MPPEPPWSEHRRARGRGGDPAVTEPEVVRPPGPGPARRTPTPGRPALMDPAPLRPCHGGGSCVNRRPGGRASCRGRDRG